MLYSTLFNEIFIRENGKCVNCQNLFRISERSQSAFLSLVYIDTASLPVSEFCVIQVLQQTVFVYFDGCLNDIIRQVGWGA